MYRHLRIGGVLLAALLLMPATGGAQDKDSVIEQLLNSWEATQDDPGVSRIDILAFENVPLKDALDIIGQKAGYRIQPAVEIPQGRITLTLEMVTAEDALGVILEATDLAFDIKNDEIRIISREAFKAKYGYEFGNGMETRIIPVLYADLNELLYKLHMLQSRDGKIHVSPSTKTLILRDSPGHLELMEKYIKERDVALETEVFELKNIQPRDIKDRIKELLTKDLGSVNVSSRSNRIEVTDTPAKIKEVAAFLKDNDRRIDVELTALVVKIALNEEHLQGIDWEAIVSSYLALPVAGEQAGGEVIPAKKTVLSMGTLTAEDLDVLLEALETVGQREDVVSSVVVTGVNEEARIVLKTSGSDRHGQGDDFELQIKVKADLDDDKNLQFQIFPDMFWSFEDGSEPRTRILQLQSGADGSRVQLSSAETVVLGGLTAEQEVQTTSKVPLLGDIPILGFAFRQQNRLMQKTEYIVFLTPQVRWSEAPIVVPAAVNPQP